MKATFNFHIDIDVDLSIEEIWPDGDAPENPTVGDVKRAFYGGKDKIRRGDVRRALDDWNLLDFEECDVTITKWQGQTVSRCSECGMLTPAYSVAGLAVSAHHIGCGKAAPTTSSPEGGAATKESTDTAASLSGAGLQPKKDNA